MLKCCNAKFGRFLRTGEPQQGNVQLQEAQHRDVRGHRRRPQRRRDLELRRPLFPHRPTQRSHRRHSRRDHRKKPTPGERCQPRWPLRRLGHGVLVLGALGSPLPGLGIELDSPAVGHPEAVRVLLHPVGAAQQLGADQAFRRPEKIWKSLLNESLLIFNRSP